MPQRTGPSPVSRCTLLSAAHGAQCVEPADGALLTFAVWEQCMRTESSSGRRRGTEARRMLRRHLGLAIFCARTSNAALLLSEHCPVLMDTSAVWRTDEGAVRYILRFNMPNKMW